MPRLNLRFEMSSAIENAIRRRAALQAEIERIDKFINDFNEFMSMRLDEVEALFDPPEPRGIEGNKASLRTNQSVDKSSKSLRGQGNPPKEIVELMERLIREAGQPLTRGQIVESLERRDVIIPAKDKERYVGTLAWRKKSIFVNIEGLGYWVRGEPMYWNKRAE